MTEGIVISEDNEGSKSKGPDVAKIADADAKFYEQSKRIAKRFAAANINLGSLQKAIDINRFTAAAKATQHASDNIGVSATMKAAQEVSADLDQLRKQTSAIAEAAKLAAPAQGMVDLLKTAAPYDRVSGVPAAAKEVSRLADAIRGLVGSIRQAFIMKPMIIINTPLVSAHNKYGLCGVSGHPCRIGADEVIFQRWTMCSHDNAIGR